MSTLTGHLKGIQWGNFKGLEGSAVISETEPVRIVLQLNVGPEADNDRIDSMTRQLRDEIRELEVQSVELVKGPGASEGARAGEVAAIGELAVALIPGVLPPLIGLLRGWLDRHDTPKLTPSVRIKTQVRGRSVELEYSPGTMSAGELKEVTDTLMASLERKEEI